MRLRAWVCVRKHFFQGVSSYHRRLAILCLNLKKDTVYYCRIARAITPKVTDSFYLKFDGWNKLVGALNFMLSLEGQEKGRKYQIDSSLNKNTITTGK